MSRIRDFLARATTTCRCSAWNGRIAVLVALLVSLGFWPFQHSHAAEATATVPAAQHASMADGAANLQARPAPVRR